jgi:hypothetical protein
MIVRRVAKQKLLDQIQGSLVNYLKPLQGYWP